MFKQFITVCLIGLSLLGQPAKGSDEAPPKIKTVDEHIVEIFGAKAQIAKAVLFHESEGMKLDAVNYNCYYGGHSKSCKKGDESKAWSVDCGIGQINVRGQVCPKTLLTLEGNMQAVEKIYKEQGLRAWVSYTTGRYKKYL